MYFAINPEYPNAPYAYGKTKGEALAKAVIFGTLLGIHTDDSLISVTELSKSDNKNEIEKILIETIDEFVKEKTVGML